MASTETCHTGGGDLKVILGLLSKGVPVPVCWTKGIIKSSPPLQHASKYKAIEPWLKENYTDYITEEGTIPLLCFKEEEIPTIQCILTTPITASGSVMSLGDIHDNFSAVCQEYDSLESFWKNGLSWDIIDEGSNEYILRDLFPTEKFRDRPKGKYTSIYSNAKWNTTNPQ